MQSTLASDLERIRALPFNHFSSAEAFIRKFYQWAPELEGHPDFSRLKQLRLWLLVPFSLWPIDLGVVGLQAIEEIANRKGLSPEVWLITVLLGNPPSRPTQVVVAQHERDLREGRGDDFIRAKYKFDFREQQLAREKQLKAEWRKIKKIFDPKKFQNAWGMVCCGVVGHDGTAAKWNVDWKNEKDRFQIVFSAFCHRWNLYGMRGDIPVLLRTAIRACASGTIMFVPSYWSFDYRRDIEWKRVNQLHRLHGSSKQGVKLGLNRLARLEEARRAKQLVKQAKAKGIRGLERDRWVMEQLGWDERTDSIRLRRLLKL